VRTVKITVDGHAHELDWAVVAVAIAGFAQELGEERGPVDGARHVEGQEGPSNGGVEKHEVAIAFLTPSEPIEPVPPPAKVQTLVLLAVDHHIPQHRELEHERSQTVEGHTTSISNMHWSSLKILIKLN
jgi:hypothetical protein